MKILLSPAKMMNLKSTSAWKEQSIPKFIKKSEELQNILKTYSPTDLENLLSISPKLSAENWERNQHWNSSPKTNESIQAIFIFKGEVYRGLEADTLSIDSLQYLHNHLFILSGLYGLLSPSDKVMPYRLEMGKKLKVKNTTDLYGFWNGLLTKHLASSLSKNEVILNLASKEYSKAIDFKQLTNPVIEIEFKDYKDGKLKSIMMYFKHARGRMTRWCAENNIQDVENLKTYNEDKYEFCEELSFDKRFVFVR